MDFVWDKNRHSNWSTDRGDNRGLLRESDWADYASATYRGTASLPFATHQRHGHDASRRVTRRAGGRHLWLDRTAPYRATRQRAHYFATSRGMQPLFSPRVPN